MATTVMTGGQLEFGSSNTADTDNVSVENSGNFFVSEGANLTLNGAGNDTNTLVGLDAPPGTNQLVTVNLNGGNNIIGETNGPLYNAVVNINLNGSAGGNYVNYTNYDNVNNVSVGGTGNFVAVNDSAANTISALGGGSAVVLGYAGDSNFGYPNTVNLGGAGDQLFGGDANFTVNGFGVTNNTVIGLGDGNDTVALGGTGGNTVVLGNGADTVTAGGNANHIFVGYGTDSVAVDGNNNLVVTNSTSSDNTTSDSILLGNNTTGNVVNLQYNGGFVGATGTGTNIVVQNQAATNGVSLSLDNNTAAVILGNGVNNITANGANSSFTIGTTDTSGNAANDLTANGNGDVATFGDGDNYATALGSNDKFTFNVGSNLASSDGLTFGGTNDVATINGASLSNTNGGQSLEGVSLTGSNDTLNLNNTSGYVQASGSGDTYNLSGDTSIYATLNIGLFHATAQNFVFSEGSGFTQAFDGKTTIAGFGGSDTLALGGLTDSNGFTFTANNTAADYTEVANDLSQSVMNTGSETINLSNSGSITLAGNPAVSKNNFTFA